MQISGKSVAGDEGRGSDVRLSSLISLCPALIVREGTRVAGRESEEQEAREEKM